MNEERYAREIGDKFIQLRGRGFDLSPLDYQLIDDWFKRGVPVFIPLNALAGAEEYRLRKPELRVRGLSYISEEVDASFAEWLEGRVGAQ